MRKILLAALLLVSHQAGAVLVTVDPDSYASGTNIGNAYAGVELTSVRYLGSGNYATSGVIAQASARSTTGGNVFGNELGGYWTNLPRPDCVLTGGLCAFAGWNAMLIEFDEATDFVSLQGNWGSDGGSIWLYDEHRNRVGSCDSIFGYASTACYSSLGSDPGEYGSNWGLSFTSLSANIKYVVASSLAAGVYFDALTYNSVNVPEPGSLALFALGGLGLLARRRRLQ